MTAPLPDAVGVVTEKLCAEFVEEIEGKRVFRPVNPDGLLALALIQSQAARIAELENGLKPFADLADFFNSWDKPLPDSASINRGTTIGHLRQARSLLSEGEGTDDR